MNKPTVESMLEVGRWIVCAIVGWIISETAGQLNLVPETYKLSIWVFTYTIPVRLGFGFALTAAGRALDKYVFVASKEDPDRKKSEDPKGILPF